MNKRDIVNQQSDFILYTSNDGDVNIEVFESNGRTVWSKGTCHQQAYGKHL
jgi:hypothetical protein